MSTSPSSSVQAARRAVADRLREIRRDANMTGKDVADRTGWYRSKVSRLENAVTPPSDDDIRAWCRACDADGLAADLIAASRSADSMYVEWRRLQRTGLRRLQESYVPLFERTRTFRIYCSNVVPGLLQTDGYAHALLGSIAAFRETPDDVSEAVAARVERSRIIREGNHRFALLVEEAVLRHRVGGAEVMAGQLGYLLSIMALPSVSLGVIPFSADRRMWMLETFSVYDEEQAQVELLTAQVNVTAPSEVTQYLKAFGEFSKLAVYGAGARARITAAIDALG
ncbi:helix-turn-helix transcriptional regulator [Streptomyces scabiei]|uniref:helix-turn-helix domain-containing protein n=1 Tax=Streptomyces scabiei TaxID=1930 RepID=UPI0029A5EFA3|nr:helix-turn-helix transcriptional regulator [Streptomyces scabiei]MDX2999637.1 helix-turn-helix transcriptional regulator [Streptomyces scabiei]MDX3035121.1 helix-turn-helix transcriptional regulator [Streptomyces scabiei]MDX3053166.1 helix-turn-helix transcriptional regulator [Streptomyces scabiei]MDX3144738.1 helix-turn-helix transcriptional regulator [Streptomyces scabiei]MDX3178511.1 helix-turn-helix transcriptional regulator [Streptomyces scabiei]